MSEKCAIVNGLIWGLLYFTDSKVHNFTEIGLSLKNHDPPRSLFVRPFLGIMGIACSSTYLVGIRSDTSMVLELSVFDSAHCLRRTN